MSSMPPPSTLYGPFSVIVIFIAGSFRLVAGRDAEF
jgi:hypothetical protein